MKEMWLQMYQQIRYGFVSSNSKYVLILLLYAFMSVLNWNLQVKPALKIWGLFFWYDENVIPYDIFFLLILWLEMFPLFIEVAGVEGLYSIIFAA